MEKEESFLTVESQLINVEGIMGIENHHLPNIIVVGKNHQWMLIFASQSIRNRIFAQSQSISPQDTYYLQWEKSNFTEEKPVRKYLGKLVKVNILSNRTN